MIANNPTSQSTEEAVRQFMLEVYTHHAGGIGLTSLIVILIGLRELGQMQHESILPGQSSCDEPRLPEQSGYCCKEILMNA
jgi:hypothetical protein